MHVKYVTPLLCAALLATGSAQPSQLEVAVKKAIAQFEPPRKPPSDALRGLRVGLDPAGEGPGATAQLDLLLAEFLYHYIIRAGGSPALSNADGRLPDAAGREARLTTLAQQPCHVWITIRHDGQQRLRLVCDQAGQSLAAALAAALREDGRLPVEVVGSNVVRSVVFEQPNRPPTCVVQLPAPACEPEAIDAEVRRACYRIAGGLFAGLVRYADGQRRWGQAEPQAPVPDCPTPDKRGRARRLAARIWPMGQPPIADQLDWFVARFAAESITDRSLTFFDIDPWVEDDTVILDGRTNCPRIVAGLAKTLRAAGVSPVRTSITPLPDRQRLYGDLLGVCRVPMVLTFDQPGGGALQTQLLYGEPVFLLDRVNEWYLLLAEDGYWGWAPCEAVTPTSAAVHAHYVNGPCVVLRRELVLDGQWLPRGALLPLAGAGAEEKPSGRARTFEVRLADGKTASVPVAAVGRRPGTARQTPRRVKAALDLLYTPYVFGGRSPLGLDCSGLITSLAAQDGQRPARDAWQQVLAGRLVATAWHRDNIRAGDQLYFINEYGKVFHTALAIDATHFVHASPPCVQIGSLDPDDRLYDRVLDKCFFVAKRP